MLMLHRVKSILRRAGTGAHTRLWVAAAAFFSLALAAVLRDHPSTYIVDNRFEQFVSPWQRALTWFFAWDGTRGLGDVREDMWPGTTLPIGLFRTIGMSAAASVRVWHAICLALVATGVVALMQVFRRPITPAHWFAGALTAFGPYSATFLVPSNLYAMFALSPWMAVVCANGLTGRRPWRWGAVFGLLVFAAGNVDPPGLVYAVVPAAILSAYFVMIEGAPNVRRVLGWWLRAGVLAVACGAWALTKTSIAWARLDQRLSETELATTAAETSSWPEVFRGLGHWVSYFISGGELVKPQGAIYFTNPFVIAATFAVPITALIGVWILRWRVRVLFGALMVSSVVLVVGGFGKPDPQPLGAAFLWSLENVTLLSGLRNTYKAGAGLAIGSAVLAGCMFWSRPLRVQGRRLWAYRGGTVLLGTATLLGVSAPFWFGDLYHPEQRAEPVPHYWEEALGALERLPPGGRTLIVPAASRAEYRWGHVGDDIFDALLSRPHAVATGVPLSGAYGADLIEVISRWTVDPVHEPGIVGAMARRLGVTEIVIRNDLDWQSSGLPRPARFDGLRDDPDFDRIATFGAEGQYVHHPDDRSAAAARERTLPPVEIYRLREPTGVVQSRAPVQELFVSGDASAWPSLAATGLLQSAATIRYTGDGAIPDARDDRLVITDTARRRVRTILDYEPTYSHTLAPEEDLGRRVHTLFPGQPDASSVAWYPDAVAIQGSVARLGGFRPEHRPAAAFDDDPATAWQVPRFEAQRRRTVLVQFREPTAVEEITFRALLGADDRTTVHRVRLRFSDGGQVSVSLDQGGVGSARFEPRTTTFVEIFAADIDPSARAVGLSEVSIPGLDLREFIQAPSDALDSTRPDHAPIAYVFRRLGHEVSVLGTEPESDEERTLRRRFLVDTPISVELFGTLRLGDIRRRDVIETLVGDEVATSLRSSGWGWLAIDGDEATGWPARAGERLLISSPEEIRTVELVTRSDARSGPVDRATVRAAGREHRIAFEEVACDLAVCRSRTTLELEEPATRLVIEDVRGTETQGSGSVHQISEVRVNGAGNRRAGADALVDDRCRDLGVDLTGNDEPLDVSMSLSGTVADLLRGEAVEFRSCETVTLGAGWHLLDTVPGLVDRMTVRSDDWPSPPSGSLIPLDHRDDGRGAARASSPTAQADEQLIVLANSFDDGWELRVGDGEWRAAALADGLNGWVVDGRGAELAFRYRPQRFLTAAIIVTLLAVASCLLLIIGWRPRRARKGDVAASDSFERAIFVGLPPPLLPRNVALAGLVVSGLAYLILGPYALLIGAATAVGLMTIPPLTIMVGGAAPLLLTAAAVATLVEETPSRTALGIDYALHRPTANEFGLVACCYVLISVLSAGLEARHGAPSRKRSRGGRLGSGVAAEGDGEVIPAAATGAVDGE